jgi:hypothetical protein
VTVKVDAITLSWTWIGLALAVPLLLALVVAIPLWLWRQGFMGNIIGSGIVLTGALFFIQREYLFLKGKRDACIRAATICRVSPDDFMRFAIYAGIGFLQVFALFWISLVLEERMRRRLGRVRRLSKMTD